RSDAGLASPRLRPTSSRRAATIGSIIPIGGLISITTGRITIRMAVRCSKRPASARRQVLHGYRRYGYYPYRGLLLASLVFPALLLRLLPAVSLRLLEAALLSPLLVAWLGSIRAGRPLAGPDPSLVRTPTRKFGALARYGRVRAMTTSVHKES